jgi:hypothetical protein
MSKGVRIADTPTKPSTAQANTSTTNACRPKDFI